MKMKSLTIYAMACCCLVLWAGTSAAQDKSDCPKPPCKRVSPSSLICGGCIPPAIKINKAETIIPLVATTLAPAAKGTAKVTRNGNETVVNVTLENSPSGTQYLYALDPQGNATSLGSVRNGHLSARTNLTAFALVLSPESSLNANSKVTLKSQIGTLKIGKIK